MDDALMRLALAEADRARVAGEVPVGAVVVFDGRVVATGSVTLANLGNAEC